MRQFMHSFSGYEAPPYILEGVRSGQITSFCLFANKNVESPQQVRALTDSLYKAAAEGRQAPPLIGIDQEGGQLMAVSSGVTDLPGNMAIGATGSEALAESAGRVLAAELLAMGINMNFAPVLDVNVNPLNPVIGVRAFGDKAESVGALGAAMTRGLQSQGVMAVGKHFPGHGDTMADTHHQDAVIAHDAERILRVELKPFIDAANAGIEGMMLAHIRLLAYDADSPATLSRVVINQLLRDKLAFNGLVMTDAMDMHAVAKYGTELSVRSALESGNDLVLLGHIEGQDELAMLFAGQERVPALQRIDRARRARPLTLPTLDTLGREEHVAVAKQIAEQAVTVVAGADNLPLRPSSEDLVVVITSETANLTPADTSAGVRITLADEIRAHHSRTEAFELPHQADGRQTIELAQAIEQLHPTLVIIGTIDATRNTAQTMLVSELQGRGLNPIVVAMRTPYDYMVFPNVETYLCTYSIRPVSMTAAARVLFGELEAVGVLPCEIPGVSPLVEQRHASRG